MVSGNRREKLFVPETRNTRASRLFLVLYKINLSISLGRYLFYLYFEIFFADYNRFFILVSFL